ncbi:hypothetical protein ASD48_32560 [Streptomyces sp. Root1310]|nr:hypothetical protein ASD48_32560 [Streptomyces sp. Root1310]
MTWTAIQSPKMTAARVMSWAMSTASAVMNVVSSSSPPQMARKPTPPRATFTAVRDTAAGWRAVQAGAASV